MKKLADDEKIEKEKIKEKKRMVDSKVAFQSFDKGNYRGSNYVGSVGHVLGRCGSYVGGYIRGNGGYDVGYGCGRDYLDWQRLLQDGTESQVL